MPDRRVKALKAPRSDWALVVQGRMMVKTVLGLRSKHPPRARSSPAVCAAAVALVVLPLLPTSASAQMALTVDEQLLSRVLPQATSFTEKIGDPPVYHGFADDPNGGAQSLVGYVFLTADLPPEEFGYSGSIEVLVGVGLTGRLTGAAVVAHHEALAASRGDFLRAPGVEEQYAGKHVGEAFRIYRDIDGISGATISAGAMARGIRNSARRVAMAYLQRPSPTVTAASDGGALTAEALERLSWLELVAHGLIAKLAVVRHNALGLDLSFAYVGNERLGDILVGAGPWQAMLEDVGPRGEDFHLMILGLDGSFIAGFRPTGLTAIQDGTAYPLPRNQVVYWGRPEQGKLAEQVFYAAMLLVDRAIDVSRPFTIQYDDNQGDPIGIEYSLPPEILAFVRGGSAPAARETVASSHEGPPPAGSAPEAAAGTSSATEAESATDSGAASAETASADDGADGGDGERTAASAGDGAAANEAEASEAQPETVVVDSARAPTVDAGQDFNFDFAEEDDESAVSLMLAQARWSRVVGLLIILGLATHAFLFKGVAVRWIALGATLVYLGWIDGGFLSVSHITSGIAGGPGVYLGDLAMLIMIVFTVVTTLLWGRVFCGFLCPFGALQDFIERVTPKRFHRRMPAAIHDRALYVKYGILALIVVVAILRSDLSIYGYFEPFGTVFFLSTSVLMWSIAGAFLLASVVIPRFYCRYACPLGAALGVASLVSFFRIPRVEQCDVCKVCEQSCPTGAIRGPDVDFKECVRCNVCESKLLVKAGVCRHDMETVNSRLVQLQLASPAGGD